MRKNFFTLRMTRNRLPKDAVEAPSLETLRSVLDTILTDVLWGTLLKQGDWTR